MSKCKICAHHLKAKTQEPCASCDVLKIIRLERRITELESLQQWHPASEPPENDRHLLVEICFPDVDVSIVDIGKHGPYCDVLGYAKDVRWQHHYMMTNGIVTRWRDMPMPEVDALEEPTRRCDTCKHRYQTTHTMRQTCSDCIERASDNYEREVGV